MVIEWAGNVRGNSPLPSSAVLATVVTLSGSSGVL